MISGGSISDKKLDREQQYEDLKASDADVAIDIKSKGVTGGGEFRAVYDLNGTEKLSLYRSGFTRNNPLDIHSVRYWYPNGTEVTGSELHIDQGRSNTEVRVPDGNGTLAFSGEAGSKTFQLPAFLEGSYEVTTPEGHRTSNFLFGSVNPSGYEREIVDNQERLRWEHVDSTISLRYYLTRDITLFAGLVGGVIALGAVGIVYYYRQVKQLREQREELGLNISIDDDSNDGPPPGFK